MEIPLLNSMFYFSVTAFFVSLFACAIYSFLETSITALRLFKLKELAQKTKRYSLFFKTLETSPQKVLITILMATCLVNVMAASLSTHIMEKVFSSFHMSGGIGFSVGVAFATLSILIFGEVIPKNLAKSRGESILKSILWLANLTFYIFKPFVPFMLNLSNFIVYKMGGKNALELSNEWISSEKEIQFLIEHINEKGLMETEKTEMLQNIFELGKIPVKEIMIPSVDIVSINVDQSIQDALHTFSKHQFTRLPVYEVKMENIIGMIHLKDIFIIHCQKKEIPIKKLVRTITFVPESMKINQLLRNLQKHHQHIAMVINEHGSITGLITLEDILEEIVGEIRDEYEDIQEPIITLKPGSWLIDASLTLSELGKLLSITFETEDVSTLGGFLTEQLQHIPKKGERLLYKNYYFQVQKATLKRVEQVLVFKEKQPIEFEEERVD